MLVGQYRNQCFRIFDLRLTVLLCILTGLLTSSCQPTEMISVVSGETMGTTYRVSIVHDASKREINTIQHEVQKNLLKINSLMSTYDNISEISRFNRVSVNQPFPISLETLEVVQFSLYLAEATGGAFDPTVGPLVDLWGFGPPGSRRVVPNDRDVKEALALVGYQSLVLDSENPALTTREARSLDLSSVAKGYAVDQITLMLDQMGYEAYLVEIGGELRSKGSKPGLKPWRVAIEAPEAHRQGVFRTLPLMDRAIATSGDYRNYFEHEGQRFSHTIDPRTGAPINHKLASVTVLAGSALVADGWATALMVLGPEHGLALADEYQIAALMLIRVEGSFELIESKAFKDYVKLTQ